MKHKKTILVLIIIIFPVLSIVVKVYSADKQFQPNPAKSNEILKEFDRNKDSKSDFWIYEDKKGVPTKSIQDADFDGIPDSWAFFKDGKAFLDEVDANKDGKVDTIYLNVADKDMNYRGFCFTIDDLERNIFIETEDTGWILKMKK